ncbi:MAG: FKBP-type peptidyl-prolyl cis-trans isomerase, partial [Armatimonadota bacterium]
MNRLVDRPLRAIMPGMMILAVALTATGCKPPESTTKAPAGVPGVLKKTDLVVGTGDEAAPGDEVWMLYTGTFKDGKVFDSNMSEGKDLYSFTINDQANVIKGWIQGIPGMKVGGTRKLEIPSDLAYGEHGRDPIPPNTPLDFEVKLAYVLKPGPEHEGDFSKEDTKPGSGPEAKIGDTVVFDYKGEYLNGVVFDDSTARPNKKSAPVTAVLGGKEFPKVIKIVDLNLQGMKPGGERVFTAAPKLLFNGFGNTVIKGGQPTKWTLKMISV